MPQLGKILIAIGIILVIMGLIIWLAGNKMHWIGNLPGDIRIEKENLRFYFPITTMIILSVIFTLIIWIYKKLF
jgi:magnesium-transporting ATPase (P-type)